MPTKKTPTYSKAKKASSTGRVGRTTNRATRLHANLMGESFLFPTTAACDQPSPSSSSPSAPVTSTGPVDHMLSMLQSIADGQWDLAARVSEIEASSRLNNLLQSPRLRPTLSLHLIFNSHLITTYTWPLSGHSQKQCVWFYTST